MESTDNYEFHERAHSKSIAEKRISLYSIGKALSVYSRERSKLSTPEGSRSSEVESESDSKIAQSELKNVYTDRKAMNNLSLNATKLATPVGRKF